MKSARSTLGSFRRASLGLLLCCFALTGCTDADPLDAVRAQQKAGKWEESIEPLLELLATQPENPEMNFLYGRALAFTQPHLAVWSLRKAMKHPDWLVPAGRQLALIALTALDFDEVIRITGLILEREPNDMRALMFRANAYAHSKRHPELAIADARRMLELDPDESRAYEPLILGLLGLDKLEEAGEALTDAGHLLRKQNDVAQLAWHCTTTAIYQQQVGDLERARATWVDCFTEHPSNLDVVTNAVNFYDSLGESDQSLEILRKAANDVPTDRTLRTLLAERLQFSGRSPEGETLLLAGTRSEDPQTAARGWMDLAQFRKRAGDYGAVSDALERSIELLRTEGTVSPQLRFEYSDALVLAGRLDRALEVAEEITVPAHRHLIRGRVAQDRRDPTGALKEFDEALQLWPDNPWARYYAALAAEELGDFDRALDEYRNSIRIEPSATDARWRAATMLLVEGKPGPAQVVLQTGRDKAPLGIDALLLDIHLAGRAGDPNRVAELLAFIAANHPTRVGDALAEAAEGLAKHGGPILAVQMLSTAPGIDYRDLSNAAALRARLRFTHESDDPMAELRSILAEHPDSSAFQEIRGLDLELSDAPAEEVRAAYARAVELAPGNARALAGLGRMAAGDDPQAALDYLDRAAAADPADPDPKIAAARVLVASGQPIRAAERLDALLIEHPYETQAAALRARLDLERGIATPKTLERARRNVRFGGGADAFELLSQVYIQLEEPELAERAAQRARALRQAEASSE